ncbi:hypothetical protein MG293_006283 [Ovis ammon polii]|uniref:Uncharacterized protein n=1 Tax=Ovis ammon polii TaxID=230172 RepID=A0AAD4YD03_OVIAM|nr:hypothetical protein MG293_006283 [Ovis ammon polii]
MDGAPLKRKKEAMKKRGDALFCGKQEEEQDFVQQTGLPGLSHFSKQKAGLWTVESLGVPVIPQKGPCDSSAQELSRLETAPQMLVDNMAQVECALLKSERRGRVPNSARSLEQALPRSLLIPTEGAFQPFTESSDCGQIRASPRPHLAVARKGQRLFSLPLPVKASLYRPPLPIDCKESCRQTGNVTRGHREVLPTFSPMHTSPSRSLP